MAMFDVTRPDNYEKVARQWADELAGRDLSDSAARMGLGWDGSGLEIPVLGRPFRVSAHGVEAAGGEGDEPDFMVKIIASCYVLQAGAGELSGVWTSYRELPGGAFFNSFLEANVETRLAQVFDRALPALDSCAHALGGEPHEGLGTGDRCYRFPALPSVPVLLIFWDGDEEFPASARILFDESASAFLDMECLAALGYMVALRLIEEKERMKGGVGE